jgi:hypothetical protein
VVAHVLALGTDASLVECKARERAVLLELPADRVRSLLPSAEPAARGFAAAFSADVVRALDQAERPMAPMIAAARSSDPTNPTVSGGRDGRRVGLC